MGNHRRGLRTARARVVAVGVVAVGVLTASIATPVRPASAARAPTVAFVGDSIGRDARARIRGLVEPQHRFVHYEAVAAGSIPYHFPILHRVVRPRRGPRIVILELGTGDAFFGYNERAFARNARRLLSDISPFVDCIRWLDIKNGGTRAYPDVNRYAAGVNRAIHRVVDSFAKAEYFHFEAWTRLAGNGYYRADLLHHNARGKVELGRMVNQAVDSCDPALTSGPFWDVRDSFWAADDIAWMADEGIADGYRNDTFRAIIGGLQPTVTRAQMANFLWNLEGSPTGFGPHRWRDGRPWIEKALRWLRAAGIATGFGGNTFRPDRPVTRGQAANLLWKMAGAPTGFAPHPWTDGRPWLQPALDWIHAAGVANGYRDGFRPDARLTRATMAHLLHAFATVPPPPAAPATPTTTTAPPVSTTTAAPDAPVSTTTAAPDVPVSTTTAAPPPTTSPPSTASTTILANVP